MANENESLGLKSGCFRWKPACWLQISGADSLSFLQGQFTNELRDLEATRAKYGLWLNHKGRVLADSFVVRARDGFWVGSYTSPAGVIRERLEAYIIADDVIIEDFTAAWEGVTLVGSASIPELNASPDAVSFPGRRSRQNAIEWLLPNEQWAAVGGALGRLPQLTATEMEWLRITAAIPAVPTDIGPGELPNEGGLDVDAVSYTKGCYLGQEVMARLKSLGQVRRRLVRVRGAGPVPTLPAPLFSAERKVGELRSAVDGADGFVGLALLSLLHFHAGEKLAWSENGEKVVDVDPA